MKNKNLTLAFSKHSTKAEGSLVYQKIIVLILILLVILVVIISFFRADILSSIRERLPSYGARQDNETSLTEDQMKTLGYEKIATVEYSEKEADSVKHYYILFYEDYLTSKNLISTPIFINWDSGKENSGNIEIVTPIRLTTWFNKKAGLMDDSRITINLTQAEYNALKQKIATLPDFKTFIKLNNAKYIGGGIYKTK
jgi:hypothetical protein